MRIFIDYHSLNNNTAVYQYPLPRTNNILTFLGGSTVYSELDLATGYQ